jgi:hypothetical protein
MGHDSKKAANQANLSRILLITTKPVPNFPGITFEMNWMAFLNHKASTLPMKLLIGTVQA